MIGWSDVVVAIPTVMEREDVLKVLLEQLAEQCPGAFRVVYVHRPGEPARVTFPRALAVAAATGRPWVLQLEDDVHLAPPFGDAALATGLDECDVLTLFSRSRRDIDAMRTGRTTRRLNPSGFSMSQAFFIRRELAADVEAYAPGWYERHPQHNRAADLLLAGFLSDRKARVLVRVPSLVQHRRGPSTLPGHHGARQSESYRQVFGEVL